MLVLTIIVRNQALKGCCESYLWRLLKTFKNPSLITSSASSWLDEYRKQMLLLYEKNCLNNARCAYGFCSRQAATRLGKSFSLNAVCLLENKGIVQGSFNRQYAKEGKNVALKPIISKNSKTIKVKPPQKKRKPKPPLLSKKLFFLN